MKPYRFSSFTLAALSASAAIALLVSPLAANAEPLKLSKADVLALMKTVKEQGAQLEQQKQALEQQQKELRRLQTKLDGAPQQAAAAAQPSAPPAAPPRAATANVQATPETGEVGTDRKPPPPDKPPEIAAVIEEGGVLLPKGKLVITPSKEYSRSSATRVAIEGFSIIPALNIGLFDISKVDRDTLTGAVSARLGITNRLEVDAKIPYVYRQDSTLNRPVGAGTADVLNEVSGNGIGDVEAGIHYQLNRGRDGWPYMIGNLRMKSVTGKGPFDVAIDTATGLQKELPTGSGFYALQPSITFLFPSDPVVFFSNMGYIYNMKRDFSGVGEVDPGDSISASFGMSLSLNDRASFSVGYSHNSVFETEVNGQKIRNSTMLQVGTLDIGYSYGFTDWMSFNVNVSAGLTEDAPDSRVTFRVPMTFDAF